MRRRYNDGNEDDGYLKITMRFTMTITMRVRIKTRTQTTFPRKQ